VEKTAINKGRERWEVTLPNEILAKKPVIRSSQAESEGKKKKDLEEVYRRELGKVKLTMEHLDTRRKYGCLWRAQRQRHLVGRSKTLTREERYVPRFLKWKGAPFLGTRRCLCVSRTSSPYSEKWQGCEDILWVPDGRVARKLDEKGVCGLLVRKEGTSVTLLWSSGTVHAMVMGAGRPLGARWQFHTSSLPTSGY
jgi:hypothetical protein